MKFRNTFSFGSSLDTIRKVCCPFYGSVLLLLIHCLRLLPLFVRFCVLCSMLCIFLFCIHVGGEEGASWFTFIVVLMSCGC